MKLNKAQSQSLLASLTLMSQGLASAFEIMSQANGINLTGAAQSIPAAPPATVPQATQPVTPPATAAATTQPARVAASPSVPGDIALKVGSDGRIKLAAAMFHNGKLSIDEVTYRQGTSQDGRIKVRGSLFGLVPGATLHLVTKGPGQYHTAQSAAQSIPAAPPAQTVPQAAPPAPVVDMFAFLTAPPAQAAPQAAPPAPVVDSQATREREAKKAEKLARLAVSKMSVESQVKRRAKLAAMPSRTERQQIELTILDGAHAEREAARSAEVKAAAQAAPPARKSRTSNKRAARLEDAAKLAAQGTDAARNQVSQAAANMAQTAPTKASGDFFRNMLKNAGFNL